MWGLITFIAQLTTHGRVLPEKLIVLEPINKSSSFYRTQGPLSQGSPGSWRRITG
jgi:hypothetical protein